MTTLSDNDIRRELGDNILIYPFAEGNLKGASYNLTASKLAWSLSTKQSIYNANEDKIVISPGDTALIETYETIWVSKKISGTYHSRVTQVSQGTGHIGTTLDPNYIGPSLIAVHNHSKIEVKLTPKTSFITLVFQYVKTDSTRDQHGNSHGRKDTLGEVGIRLTSEESDVLDQPYMSNKELLKSKLEECPDYHRIKTQREEESKRIKLEQQKTEKNSLSRKLYILIIGAIVLLLLSSLFLQSNQKQLGEQKWYAPTTASINLLINLLSSAFTALITVDLTRRI